MLKKIIKYVLLLASIALITVGVLGFRKSSSYESNIQENNNRLAEVNYSYSSSSDMIRIKVRLFTISLDINAPTFQVPQCCLTACGGYIQYTVIFSDTYPLFSSPPFL